MKRSNVEKQSELFSNVPAPPAMTTLQLHHNELIDLVGRVLWEVVRGPSTWTSKENDHEQDQR
jgi:hypothetical protein